MMAILRLVGRLIYWSWLIYVLDTIDEIARFHCNFCGRAFWTWQKCLHRSRFGRG